MNAEMIADKSHSEEEWLAARRTGVTATDAAKVLGLSSWGGPRSVAAEKRGEREEPTPEQEERFWFGHAAETMIFQRLRATLPATVGVERCSAVYRSHRFPWLLASPDGFIVAEDRRHLAEAKGTTMEPWARVPEDYRVQVHVQALVLALEDADNAVYALHRGSQLMRYPVPFDRSLADRIINETGEWWRRFQAGEEFVPSGSDLAKVREANPLVGGTRAIDPALALAYVEARSMAKAARLAQDAAQAALIEALGGSAVGQAGALVVRRTQIAIPAAQRAAYTQDRLTVSRTKGA